MQRHICEFHTSIAGCFHVNPFSTKFSINHSDSCHLAIINHIAIICDVGFGIFVAVSRINPSLVGDTQFRGINLFGNLFENRCRYRRAVVISSHWVANHHYACVFRIVGREVSNKRCGIVPVIIVAVAGYLCGTSLSCHFKRTFIQSLRGSVFNHAAQQFLQCFYCPVRSYFFVYHDGVESLHHIIAPANLLHKLRFHHFTVVSNGIVISQQGYRSYCQLITY